MNFVSAVLSASVRVVVAAHLPLVLRALGAQVDVDLALLAFA
jgi:hypothetical protein